MAVMVELFNPSQWANESVSVRQLSTIPAWLAAALDADLFERRAEQRDIQRRLGQAEAIEVDESNLALIKQHLLRSEAAVRRQ